MKKLQLYKGETALIDDDDYAELTKIKWWVSSRGYIKGLVDGQHTYLHRHLMKLCKGDKKIVDHIWGLLIAIIATGLQMTGVVSISDIEQVGLVDRLLVIANLLAQLFGFILAIYGRVTAKHAIGNPLDNRKSNLRICTNSENIKSGLLNNKISTRKLAQQLRNDYKIPIRRNTYGHKGVSWNTRDRRWKVQVCHNKNIFYVGYFINIDEEITAYNEASKQIKGGDNASAAD